MCYSDPIMVTYTLMGIMSVTSFSTLFWPSLTDVFNGIGELSHPWQPWTAVFVHGWPGMPTLLHLVGNLVLLALVGPVIERRLGSFRLLGVILLAIFAAGILRILTRVEFNGASAFIWAYAPFLWLIVPLAMVLILTLNGVYPITAFVLGNIYHLSGTIVGFGATWFWRYRLPDKL